MNKKKKNNNKIAKLNKRKNKSLKMALMEMLSMSRVTIQGKTGWTGEEINVAKDIIDFCRDRLHPEE